MRRVPCYTRVQLTAPPNDRSPPSPLAPPQPRSWWRDRRPSKSSTRIREWPSVRSGVQAPVGAAADANTIKTAPPHRWKSDVNAFPQLDRQLAEGPAYEYEYSTREAYGGAVPGWGRDDPLNATWWHLVTEGANVALYPWPALEHESGRWWIVSVDADVRLLPRHHRSRPCSDGERLVASHGSSPFALNR